MGTLSEEWLDQLRADRGYLSVGAHRLRVLGHGVFGRGVEAPPGADGRTPDWGIGRGPGLVLGGYLEDRVEDRDDDSDDAPPDYLPPDYLNDLLLRPESREACFELVDTFGLLVCQALRSEHPSYRDVRGRSSRGRLSQGEYYHHDGCSGPVKPRVVEIRFDHQEVPRQVATAVAPFEAIVEAMLSLACERLTANPQFQTWRRQLAEDSSRPPELLDLIQGGVTRALRRELAAEDARAFFRQVDEAVDAYRPPWQMGESRLISNRHPQRGAHASMQHRRAYLVEHSGGQANGSLVKRWPAEELE